MEHDQKTDNVLSVEDFSRRRQTKSTALHAEANVSKAEREEDNAAEPDPYAGMNEFEKRKAFNDSKRKYDNHPYYRVKTIDEYDAATPLGALFRNLEENCISFGLEMDFDKYPYPNGKTPEMEFLHRQYREATSRDLQRSLYRKLILAIYHHNNSSAEAKKTTETTTVG